MKKWFVLVLRDITSDLTPHQMEERGQLHSWGKSPKPPMHEAWWDLMKKKFHHTWHQMNPTSHYTKMQWLTGNIH